MRISRVHVEAELAVGEQLRLDLAQSHYLKHVLRLKSGAAVVLFNGRDPIDYGANLVLDGKQVNAEITSAQRLDNESKLDSEIIQGLARADHLDWMIQKTTELGVNSISIFNAARSQPRLKSAQQQKKLKHWRGVAISACEQSGRAIIPLISFHSDLEEALAAAHSNFRLLLDFDGIALSTALQPAQAAVSILLGPEGGLNPPEIQLARTAGYQPVSLGPRVLRTETAATTALSIAQSVLGDLS